MFEDINKSLDSQKAKLGELLLQQKELTQTLSNLDNAIQQIVGAVRALEYVKSLEKPADGVQV